jgi:hypothetical protein
MNNKRPVRRILKISALVSLPLIGFVIYLGYLGHTSPKQLEYDAQRMRDILAISDMVEAYYEINNHYPLVKEPQSEMINVFISDNIPEFYPPSPPYQSLEAELQKTLGEDVVLPKDPSEDGRPYQYATNGANFYVAAILFHKKSFAWDQGYHANKIEVTSSPNLQARSYRPDYLRHIIRFGPDDANTQAEFIEALQEHNFDVAATLLKNGANPSPMCKPNHRCQPLATAAMNGDLEVMKFLINNGADLDGYNSYNDVALIYALENRQLAAAKLLVESGANVNIPNAFGISPFIGASNIGDTDLLTSMIQNGADLDGNYSILVEDGSEKGPRPLTAAILMGRELSKLRVSMSSKGESVEAITAVLAELNLPGIIALLLAAGADPSLQSTFGVSITELGRKSDNRAIRELF